MFTAPIARIILRYGSGVLVTVGVLNPDLGGQIAADQDILQILQIGIGSAAGVATEVWYHFARKWGRAT